MATEVQHGLRPKFKAKLQRGKYGCVVCGQYTTTPGLTAAGVAVVHWNSKRRIKRQAELLGMRTAFLCWFVVQYERLGGSWKDGVEAVTRYPFRRLRRRIVKLRKQKKRLR
jgi:hypothetical protein